jgi:hypothetical protein
VRRRSVLLLSLVVLAGCGGRGDVSAVPEGFTVRTVDEPTLSVALPAGWRSFGDRAHTNARQVAGKNRRLRLELQVLAKSNSPVKLVGFDPSSAPRLSTNMNVLETRVPSALGFEEMARAEARQITLASGVRDIRQEVTKVPAGRTLHLTYSPNDSIVLEQYFVRHGDLLYVLTYTTRLANARRDAKVFSVSAHTFEVG